MREEWRDIDGYVGVYQVSNLGRIKSLQRYVPNSDTGFRFIKEKILHTACKVNKYIKVNLSGKSFRVHRLVAKSFISNSENLPEVNHLDGFKPNNSVDNLEWCTSDHNMKHNMVIGITPKGNDHVNSTITEDQAREIKLLLTDGLSMVEIAKKIGTNDDIVYQVKKGLTWKHVVVESELKSIHYV